MRCHHAGGINQTLGILDEGTLERIRIVRGPNLVAIAQRTVIYTATTGGATLYQYMRVFFPNASHHIVQSLNIRHIEFILRGAQIRTAKTLNHAVAIPFDIVDIRGQLHGPVKNAIHKILHGRIGQVQHPLVTPLINFPAGTLHHPFRMGMSQLRVWIHHLGLYPDAKLESFGVGI